jgi:hypothetical protein
MANVKRFDRHENMSSETREEIMDLIIKLKLSDFGDFELINSLYGLFDGYYYEDTLKEHQRVVINSDFSLGMRLSLVMLEVQGYPEGVTQVF